MRIYVKEGASCPEYQTRGSAGADIRAFENVTIPAGETRVVATGLFMEVPDGWEVQIRPRSGLAAKQSVTVLNTPGTIDSDYRGEVKVILHNAGKNDFGVAVGDRIAQMVLSPVKQAFFEKVSNQDELSETARGKGGFGSTGVQ